MTSLVHPCVAAIGFLALGLAVAAIGVYVAAADDAPGAAVLGMLMMASAVALGVKTARRRLPGWAARTALAVGVALAAGVAFVTREVAVTRPLFSAAQAVPATAGPAGAPEHATAIERAREIVRAAIMEHNLPGVSVAVGTGGVVVWAEGFGWRDVATRSPVTPATRFVIGTAASVLAPAVAPLGLADTGAEPAAAWSPDHIGEPEEDFPLFTLLRHVVFQPLGLAALEPLPGDRATFYLPGSRDRPGRGRRLMAMRDLGCCAGGLAFYSTPSDLVRSALAASAGGLDGELAGGTVVSLVVKPENDLVVAVTSNITHAGTHALAARVAAAFTGTLP